jgi:hypothetical protein
LCGHSQICNECRAKMTFYCPYSQLVNFTFYWSPHPRTRPSSSHIKLKLPLLIFYFLSSTRANASRTQNSRCLYSWVHSCIKERVLILQEREHLPPADEEKSSLSEPTLYLPGTKKTLGKGRERKKDLVRLPH